jgi:transposase
VSPTLSSRSSSTARRKNDAADAAGICEAMVRPNIHNVAEQQSVLALHTVRVQSVVARSGFVNAVRASFAAHGMVVSLGRGKLAELATMRLHLPARTAFALSGGAGMNGRSDAPLRNASER